MDIAILSGMSFVQLNVQPKNVEKGTGPGLNISCNIIKKHRGAMNVESA